MKRLFTVLFIALMLSGCASTGNFTGNQIKGDEEISAIAEIAARRIGYYLVKNESVNIETIKKYIDQMDKMDDEQIQTMALYGMRYLATKYTGDPLLADDLISLIKLLGIDLAATKIDLDSGDLKTLKAVIGAVRKGMGV